MPGSGFFLVGPSGHSLPDDGRFAALARLFLSKVVLSRPPIHAQGHFEKKKPLIDTNFPRGDVSV